VTPKKGNRFIGFVLKKLTKNNRFEAPNVEVQTCEQNDKKAYRKRKKTAKNNLRTKPLKYPTK
jgi:hypothetical protein